MLVSLSIRSFLLIDALDLQAGAGFTALTGETGAGKSLLLSALNLALGAQAKRDQIALGADQAVLVAEFVIPEGHPVWNCLDAHCVAASSDQTLLLKRVISKTGPSRSFINDNVVSLNLLAEIGSYLVEVHGQHASTDLLRTQTHEHLLDRFGDLEPLVDVCKTAWQSLQRAKQSQAKLLQDQAETEAAHANCREAIDALAELAPEPGEYQALIARRKIISQSAKFVQSVHQAQQQLEQECVRQALCQADRALLQLAETSALQSDDSGLRQQVVGAREAVERTLIELTEAQSVTHALASQLEHDPHRLEDLDDRLAALRLAARNYGGTPEDLPHTFAAFQAQDAAFMAAQMDVTSAQDAVDAAYADWRQKAERLSAGRRKAAKRLETAMRAELKPLRLKRVRFRVALSDRVDTYDGWALEQVSFEVETNTGMGFGPLHKIASGGELSRFSLALKCALQRSKAVSRTLIFDEIDIGVGGAVAMAIGGRLEHLADTNQVFAITHSPQVAACAHEQWRVSKQSGQSGHMSTRICALNKRQRLEEIARMLSGSSITDEARAAASKLLEVA